MCLLGSVEFLCLAWRNDAVWFVYLLLKSFSVSPMHFSVVLRLRLRLRLKKRLRHLDSSLQAPQLF